MSAWPWGASVTSREGWPWQALAGSTPMAQKKGLVISKRLETPGAKKFFEIPGLNFEKEKYGQEIKAHLPHLVSPSQPRGDRGCKGKKETRVLRVRHLLRYVAPPLLKCVVRYHYFLFSM